MPAHSKLSLAAFRLLSLLGFGTLGIQAAFAQDQPPWPASESMSTLGLEVIEPLAVGGSVTSQPAARAPPPFIPTHHLPVDDGENQSSEVLFGELIFPRPRLQFRIRDDRAVYISGELGGGTWAIERVDGTNDNATYRDLRMMLGVMEFGQQAQESAFEIGWAFSRSLAYRSGVGDYHMDDSFIMRFRQHY